MVRNSRSPDRSSWNSATLKVAIQFLCKLLKLHLLLYLMLFHTFEPIFRVLLPADMLHSWAWLEAVLQTQSFALAATLGEGDLFPNRPKLKILLKNYIPLSMQVTCQCIVSMRKIPFLQNEMQIRNCLLNPYMPVLSELALPSQHTQALQQKTLLIRNVLQLLHPSVFKSRHQLNSN